MLNHSGATVDRILPRVQEDDVGGGKQRLGQAQGTSKTGGVARQRGASASGAGGRRIGLPLPWSGSLLGRSEAGDASATPPPPGGAAGRSVAISHDSRNSVPDGLAKGHRTPTGLSTETVV
jgi:hypothetical protein